MTRPSSALSLSTMDWYNFRGSRVEKANAAQMCPFMIMHGFIVFFTFPGRFGPWAFSGFAYAFFIILCLFSDAPVVPSPPTAVHVRNT